MKQADEGGWQAPPSLANSRVYGRLDQIVRGRNEHSSLPFTLSGVATLSRQPEVDALVARSSHAVELRIKQKSQY